MGTEVLGTRRKARPLPQQVGLRDAGPGGVPFESRLADFGGVEVRRHRFPPGEAVVSGFGGHLVTLHLGAPTRAELRQGDLAASVTETEGNVMVVPAEVPAWQALRDASEAVNVMLDGGLVGRVAEEAGGCAERVEVVGSFEDRDPRVAGIMLAFLSELESGGHHAGGALHANGLAHELAVHLLRYHSSLGRAAARRLAPRDSVGLTKRELAVAVEYVNGNLSRDFSLAELAGAVGLSPHHFARLFRLSTGLAPHQYAVRRAEKAKGLLLRGRPPGLAAVEAGFYDQSHMGRHFRRVFGTTPKRALAEATETSKNVL